MPKYKDYYQKMFDQNKELFLEFMTIHDKFQKDRQAHQEEYNQKGREVVDIIRDWERRLCSGQSKGKYARYSHRTADKFWDIIRKDYPLIDLVGVKITKRAKK